jgi:hypothetical protein
VSVRHLFKGILVATKKLGSVKNIDTVLVTSVNLAADVGATILPVANGGTGNGSFTDGQLLIGKTTGNTLAKATLSGTANQIIVTNGSGSITLSTPQSIAATNSPTFAGLTLTAALSIASGGTGEATGYAALDALTLKGSDIASAGTTNLSSATGCYVNITGTTTIIALGTAAAGVERVCQFAGSLTLTHNATSLILPGAANITTNPGDVATFVSLGSGNWICTGLTRNVQPWGGQMVLLATATASASATVDFIWAAGQAYQEYLVIFSNLLPATTSVTLQALTSPDGSSWDSGASNYSWAATQYLSGNFSSADVKLQLAGGTVAWTTTANREASGEVRIIDPGASKNCKLSWHISSAADGTSRPEVGAGARLSAAAVRGIRFKFSSGNIATGDFRLYGITRS